MITSMPKSRLNLPPVDLGNETMGQRLARLRNERGYTQVQLAQKMGLIQSLISGYEIDRIRPHPEMVARFAIALDVDGNELLGLRRTRTTGRKPPLRFIRRVEKIEELPPHQQRSLLDTIDNYLKANVKSA